jgi:hypothetical protein
MFTYNVGTVTPTIMPMGETCASLDFKVILLADLIRSRLLSWFGSPIITKIPEYHSPNVYGYRNLNVYCVYI